MGNRVVKDFEFSPDFGFTGSAGKQVVKGYMRGGAAKAKVGKVIDEFKAGKLRSGAPDGPVVESPKQAVAIALGAARKAPTAIPESKPAAAPMMAKAKPTFNSTPMIAPPAMRKGGKVGR